MAEWKKELGRASGVQFEYPRGSGEALLTKEALVLCRGRILASASAQLKASSTFNSIEKFTSQKCLVIELRELQQVHAGAGCGEPLKVRASVVNTKCGIQLLKPQQRGSRAACYKLQQFALFFISEPFHNSPEDLNNRMVCRIASWIVCKGF